MKFEVKRVNVSDIAKNVANLKDVRMAVGWFDDVKYDDNTKVMDVAEWQEFGKEEFNVAYPPRPFMRPAENKYGNTWVELVRKKVKECVEQGKPLTDAFEYVGEFIKGNIQEAIIDVMEPPLAESTIKARQKRGNNSTKPLVDTGLLLASVSKKVEEI